MSGGEAKKLGSKQLELEDDELYEKYRYELARSLVSRMIDSIYDLVEVYAELNCKTQKDDFKRMCRDCCIAFEKQEEHKLLEFKFVNLLRYCCIPEFSGKKYWHYNFIAETKNSESGTWTRGTYFAETKLEHGVQNFFCCLLDLSDNGECYGCKNQKAEIQHPTRGDYQRATPDHDWPSNDDEISDDDAMDC